MLVGIKIIVLIKKNTMTTEKVKVLIVPNSDDEKSYENCKTLSEAIKCHETFSDDASLHEFDTQKEAEAFIMGYSAGVGYLGNGTYFSNL